MSILIVRGPAEQGVRIRGAAPLPRELLSQLVDSAGRAGCVLSVRACGSEQELLDAVRVAHQGGAEALILDADACAGSARLKRALTSLRLPCVQVDTHAIGMTSAASNEADGHVASVQGYGLQGYVLALYIVLDHLGCGEWSETFHVGT
jgi:3-dehydroquinate dehydratase-1